MDTNSLLEQFEPYQALLFDLDGTLADTMPLHYQACQEVCNPLGFEFPLDFFHDQAGIPTKQVFINLMKKLNLPHDGISLAVQKEKRFIELIPLVKPMEFSLALIKKFGHLKKIAIGSGGERITVIKTLEALNLDVDYHSIITADDVQHHKPHPETFMKCAEACGIPPSKCVVLEDGILGMQAANTAQMDCFDIVKMTFFR